MDDTNVQLRQAAQYLRMSTDHQRYSLANQALAISAFALEHGFDVTRSYVDAGKSGVTAHKRSGLKALLADVIGGDAPFGSILVLDVTRWGRFQDPDEAAHYEFLCREAGVDIIYCAELFGSDPTSSILKQLKRVMAGEYSRELSNKVRAAKTRRASQGFATGGVAPFGFRRQAYSSDNSPGPLLVDGECRSRLDQEVRYVPGPASELKTIRLIFDLYVHDGFTHARISERLNALGRPWKNGARWDNARVRSVLRSEFCIGIRVYNTAHQTLGNLRAVPPEEWMRVRLFPPVIPLKLFEAARRKRRILKRSGMRWTDEDLLKALKRLHLRSGKLTAQSIRDASDLPSTHVYATRFGSLRRAYALVGAECSVGGRPPGAAPPPMHSADIIEGVQRLYRERGWISSKMIAQDTRLPSLTTLYRRFGSLCELYDAAGIALERNGPAHRAAVSPD